MAIWAKLKDLRFPVENDPTGTEPQALIEIPLNFERCEGFGEFERVDPLTDRTEWLGLMDEIIKRGEILLPLDKFCVDDSGEIYYFWVPPERRPK
jgi:hypothetical protein